MAVPSGRPRPARCGGPAKPAGSPRHPYGVNRPVQMLLRILATIWALPTTLVGLLLLGLAVVTGGRASLVDGVLEAHGGWVRWALARMPVGRGGGATMTLGHVVLGTSQAALAVTRAHERAHVSQCERWGPFFLPAYAIASLFALMRGADPYRDNRFEREAFAVANPADEDAARLASRGGRSRST